MGASVARRGAGVGAGEKTLTCGCPGLGAGLGLQNRVSVRPAGHRQSLSSLSLPALPFHRHPCALGPEDSSAISQRVCARRTRAGGGRFQGSSPAGHMGLWLWGLL